MRKVSGNWFLSVAYWGVRTGQESAKKTHGRWLVLLACTLTVFGWIFPSVAFADYYTAAISSCYTVNSPGASMYSLSVSVDQCNGSLRVSSGKIVFSDTIYYPVVTITFHRHDGTTISNSYPIFYTDNCNLLITGDPSCLPESAGYTPNPDTGDPKCNNQGL